MKTQRSTIATILLFGIGISFSGNSFAGTHVIGEPYGGGKVFYTYPIFVTYTKNRLYINKINF